MLLSSELQIESFEQTNSMFLGYSVYVFKENVPRTLYCNAQLAHFITLHSHMTNAVHTM